MKTINNFLSEELISAIGWTIIHSLWQGAVLVIILAILLIFLQKFSAKTRYFISVGFIFLFLFCSIITLRLHVYTNNKSKTISDTSSIVSNKANQDESDIKNSNLPSQKRSGLRNDNSLFFNVIEIIKNYCNTHLALIVTLWLLGILVLTLRFLGGLAYIQRLKFVKTEKVSELWLLKVKNLCEAIGLNKSFKLLNSGIISIPMLIGVFKPVILLPVKLLSGLTEKQIEAILIHELAHLKRNDYAINIIQSLVEVLFFYHPAIWWLSSNARTERENCCDDLAISITGEAINYANALVELKEIQLSKPVFAVAFSGNKNKFNHRIKRIFKKPTLIADFKEGFITALILMTGITVILLNAFTFLISNEDSDDNKIGSLEIYKNTDDAEKNLNISMVKIDFQKQNTKNEIINNTIKWGKKAVLLEAIDNGKIQLAKSLIMEGTSLKEKTKDGWTALMEAIDEGYIEIAQLLLLHGVNVHDERDDGWNALMEAVDDGHIEIVKLLLAKGADVNKQIKDGWTALMSAAAEGDYNIAKLLIEHGADVNAKSHDGRNVLMWAICEGHVPIVELLLENNAYVNYKTKEGWSALMEAIQKKDYAIVELLVENGANLDYKVSNGISIMQLVEGKENSEIIAFLKAHIIVL